MTIVMKCDCYNPFQDKRYGAGKRLHNVQLKDRKHSRKARCTVCGVSRDTSVPRQEGIVDEVPLL